MVEERTTRVETPGEGTHSHTTVVSDSPRRGGGGTIIIVIALIALAVLAFVLLVPMRDAEVSRDNAVAEAAGQVGAAASEVGDAARSAADSVTGE